MNKGQGSTIDLFASIAIFIVVVALVIYYYAYITNRIQQDLQYEELQIRAYRIADLLTKTPGEPSRWEALPGTTIDASKMSSLGLAINDRQISREKALNLTRLDYNDIKKLLNIEPYEFNITIKIKDDIVTLLRKYDIRIAYIQIGTKSFPDSLEQALKGLFDCKSAGLITNRKLERCEEYTSAASLNDPDGAGTAFATNFNVFENLSEYDLLLMEDPRLAMSTGGANEPTYTHSQKIINFTKNGGFAIFTIGMVENTPGNPHWYLMGINWTDGAGNPTTLTVADEYYDAITSGDETFIKFPGTKSSPDVFSTNKKDSYINAWKSNESVSLLKMLYPSTDTNKISGARWEFGKGRIYYFSDGKDTVISDEVGVASRRIVQNFAASLFSNILTSGKSPPKNADIVAVQRDVLFENKTAIMEITMWIP